MTISTLDDRGPDPAASAPVRARLRAGAARRNRARPRDRRRPGARRARTRVTQAASKSCRRKQASPVQSIARNAGWPAWPAWHFATMTDPEKPCRSPPIFRPATREDWRKLVDAVLKGAPFERLVSTTYDGLAIEPLAARRSDARAARGAAGRRGLAGAGADRSSRSGARQRDRAARARRTAPAAFRSCLPASVGDHGFGLPASEEALSRACSKASISPPALPSSSIFRRTPRPSSMRRWQRALPYRRRAGDGAGFVLATIRSAPWRSPAARRGRGAKKRRILPGASRRWRRRRLRRQARRRRRPHHP